MDGTISLSSVVVRGGLRLDHDIGEEGSGRLIRRTEMPLVNKNSVSTKV